MRFTAIINRMERIDRLTRLKATGTPTTLARRLEISERCLYRTIEMMKDFGAPIYYCNNRQSYCYESNVKFTFGFTDK